MNLKILLLNVALFIISNVIPGDFTLFYRFGNHVNSINIPHDIVTLEQAKQLLIEDVANKEGYVVGVEGFYNFNKKLDDDFNIRSTTYNPCPKFIVIRRIQIPKLDKTSKLTETKQASETILASNSSS